MSERFYVLDASALLAVFQAERGAERVTECLATSCISAVNLAEVAAKLAERGVPDDAIRESIADLDLDVRPFDGEQALRTGELRPRTRALGLSLGDRACLALAASLDAVALTAERAWQHNAVGVSVELIR
jgi:PIN domain nuclease of toxin-antitoxin system